MDPHFGTYSYRSPYCFMSRNKIVCYPSSHFVSYNHLSHVFLEFITNMSLECIPKCLCKALPHPKWKEVVLDEMRAFEKNKTWVLTSHRKGKYSIGCKWVFTLKYNLAGMIHRHKACLVPNWFTQLYELDYLRHFLQLLI